MERRTSIIDADSIIYILAWNNREHQDEKSMELQVDQFMTDLIVKTKATHYLGVFTPGVTFRNGIYPEYKANRKKVEIPEWISFWKPKIIELCIRKYQFIIADFIEADDVLSLLRGIDGKVIFCSPDKDLKQIPGTHYNYAKDIWTEVSTEEAEYTFWTSMVTGDTTDNIKGIKKQGPVAAKKILEGLSHENEGYAKAVHAKYLEVYGVEEGREQFILNYRLLKMLDPNKHPVWAGKPIYETVNYYSTKIQEVAYEETELNIDTDGVLQSDQRPHEDDLLLSTLGDAQ